jgi:hypothetical protein
MEWILHPLTNYALLAAGMGLCLWLYFHCERGIALVKSRLRSDRDLHELRISGLLAELGLMRKKLEEIQQQFSAGPTPVAPHAGMNITRRTQVLRMQRRGERPEQIAAALNLPQSEVELLLKLHLAALEVA